MRYPHLRQEFRHENVATVRLFRRRFVRGRSFEMTTFVFIQEPDENGRGIKVRPT